MVSSPLYLTPAQTAQQLGLTPGHLAQLRYTGKGPLFVKLTGRAVRYRQADIDAWVESSLRMRTDERPASRLSGGAA